MSRSIGRTPPPRPRLVVSNPGTQLVLPLHDVLDEALPLARQLRLMAAEYGPASADLADELVALLDSQARLEIAVIQGNAARGLSAGEGAEVLVFGSL